MRKLKLEIDALRVESFAPEAEQEAAGTVRAYFTAYYELCYEGDTWQQSCTCEPTCNAETCYSCQTGCGACQTAGGTCGEPACTGTCYPISMPRTSCSVC
jgi:hypothetical protein